MHLSPQLCGSEFREHGEAGQNRQDAISWFRPGGLSCVWWTAVNVHVHIARASKSGSARTGVVSMEEGRGHLVLELQNGLGGFLGVHGPLLERLLAVVPPPPPVRLPLLVVLLQGDQRRLRRLRRCRGHVRRQQPLPAGRGRSRAGSHQVRNPLRSALPVSCVPRSPACSMKTHNVRKRRVRCSSGSGAHSSEILASVNLTCVAVA